MGFAVRLTICESSTPCGSSWRGLAWPVEAPCSAVPTAHWPVRRLTTESHKGAFAFGGRVGLLVGAHSGNEPSAPHIVSVITYFDL